MSRFRNPGRILLLALPLLLLFVTACGANKLAPTFSHQGRLLDSSGAPVPDGTYEVTYGIFHTSSGGTAVHEETQSVTVTNGLFTVSVMPFGGSDPTIFARPAWLQITVEGEVLTPRQRLQGSPYAFSLVSGSVVQGAETRDRSYAGQVDTGATMAVWNTDATATGGSGLLAINGATPASIADRERIAALQARALGTSYSGVFTAEQFRGIYVKGGGGYADAHFDGTFGIIVNGASGCVGCTMAYMAQNVGASPINAGDFVAISGVETDPDLDVPIMLVRKATSADDVVIGVATSAATRNPVEESNGTRVGGFNPAAGPAATNGYLSVVVQGLVQVRAAGTDVQPGTSLNAGTDGAEASAGLGFTRALSEVDGDGMVWVMLSGQ